MKKFGETVISLFIFTLLCSTPPSEGIPSLPPSRLERARALLDIWEGWFSETAWKATSKRNLRKKGDPCNVLPLETLKQMYYLRLRYTMTGSSNIDAPIDYNYSGYYKMLDHVARSLSYYQQRMTMSPPPLRERHHFCQNEVDNPDFPGDNDTSNLFRWPPKPFPLVCELDRCTSCAGKIDTEIKEACELPMPPSDNLEPLSQAQELFEKIQNTIGILPPKDFLASKEITEPDTPCDATPDKSQAYIILLHVFKYRGEDPKTLQEYRDDWEAIDRIAGDYEFFRNIFINYTKADVTSKTYYKFSLDETAFKEGKDVKGGLVCGGMTCKICKIRPIAGEVRQEWVYLQGPMYEACNFATTLEIGWPYKEKNGTCTKNLECPKIPPVINGTLVSCGGATDKKLKKKKKKVKVDKETKRFLRLFLPVPYYKRRGLRYHRGMSNYHFWKYLKAHYSGGVKMSPGKVGVVSLQLVGVMILRMLL